MLHIVKLKNEILLKRVKVANTFWSRIIGLMFKNEHVDMDGLIITPCSSIHTFFMRYKIDVIFLDKSNKVIKVISEIKPWRMTWFYLKAQKVLEYRSGSLITKINEGDQLEITKISR